MKFILISTRASDINLKNLKGDLLGEDVLLEINERLKQNIGNPVNIRGLSENGSALKFSNCSGVHYWIFKDVDENAIDAIIKEEESLSFAEISLSEQKSSEFWRNDFKLNVKNIEFKEINRVADESNKLSLGF